MNAVFIQILATSFQMGYIGNAFFKIEFFQLDRNVGILICATFFPQPYHRLIMLN